MCELSELLAGSDKEDHSDVPDSDSSDYDENGDGTTNLQGLKAMRYEWKALETFSDKESADNFRKSLPFAHTWHSGGHGQRRINGVQPVQPVVMASLVLVLY